MLKITETALVLLYSALWLVQKTRVTLFQPIRCEIKIIHNLVARVFPRFTESSYFYFEFSLAVRRISLSSVWPLLLKWFWFYALNRKVLYVLCLGEHSTKYLSVYPIFAWSYFKILQIRSSSVFFQFRSRAVILFLSIYMCLVVWTNWIRCLRSYSNYVTNKSRIIFEGGKFLKKLWYCVGGRV